MEENLRWILIAAGVVLLTGIYVWGRRRERAEDRRFRDMENFNLDGDPLDTAPDQTTMGESLQAGDDIRNLRGELEELEGIIREEEARPAASQSEDIAVASGVAGDPSQEKLITLFMVMPKGERISGPMLLDALRAEGLQFGDMNIFHRIPSASSRPVFSVANIVEPGTLEPDAMKEFSTPGLVLFMRLPGPVEGLLALDDLVNTAHSLVGKTGARLLDESRSDLTPQVVEHLRQEIGEFQRLRRLARPTA